MSYNQYQTNPYTQGSAAEQGYGGQAHGQQGGYGQEHEMQSYPPHAQNGGGVLSSHDFLELVRGIQSQIESLDGDVKVIANLHQRALQGSDSSAAAQLEGQTTAIQQKNSSIREQIQQLKSDVERTSDGSRTVKTRQFKLVNTNFRAAVNRHYEEEQSYQKNYREQIARQYRIVNPDATQQEVEQATEGNMEVFQQALQTSNRSGQASAVLGAVRARQNELQKIEKSMAELAQLFQDLDTLVVLQEPTVMRAEEQTEEANQNLQSGNRHVDDAIVKARHRRKLKWWCALVVVLIIIAIALGVGLGIALAPKPPK